MSDSAKLLELLKGEDVAAANDFLTQKPEAARGRGPNGESLILTAVYSRRLDLATRLAELSAPDLCEAAALGDENRVLALLKDGASTATQSTDGWTPLHLAGFMGHLAVARALLASGATVDALSTNAIANTPLCATLAGSGSADVVRLLLDEGADVNARVELGVTPLHLAASRGADALVSMLLARGASRSATMDDGTTPASIARARGHHGTAALLDADSTPA